MTFVEEHCITDSSNKVFLILNPYLEQLASSSNTNTNFFHWR